MSRASDKINKMLVLARAVPGQVDELARWYDEQHIPDLLAVPGVVSAERHTIVPLKRPDGAPEWDFLLIYEFTDDDPSAIIGNMGERRGTDLMKWTDALEGTSTVSLVGLSSGWRGTG